MKEPVFIYHVNLHEKKYFQVVKDQNFEQSNILSWVSVPWRRIFVLIDGWKAFPISSLFFTYSDVCRRPISLFSKYNDVRGYLDKLYCSLRRMLSVKTSAACSSHTLMSVGFPASNQYPTLLVRGNSNEDQMVTMFDRADSVVPSQFYQSLVSLVCTGCRDVA